MLVSPFTLHKYKNAWKHCISVAILDVLPKKKQKSEFLSPTTDSLHHHIERCNYQALIWKRSMEAVQALPTPSSLGWDLHGENLEVLYMSREPAPKGLLELTVCKCKKSGCKRSDLCPCRANEMCCTSGDECDNPFKVLLDFSDDEDSWPQCVTFSAESMPSYCLLRLLLTPLRYSEHSLCL